MVRFAVEFQHHMAALGTKHLGRILLVAGLLVSTTAHPNDFWKRKPASEWTVEEALKVLQDSPWARKQVVATPKPRPDSDFSVDSGLNNCDPDAVDASGRCLEWRVNLPVDASRRTEITQTNYTAVILVRWESATPVSQAFTRLAELGARVSAMFQAPPPLLPVDRYVVTVKAIETPSQGADPLAGVAEGNRKPRAWLKTAGGTVAPLEWERSGVGASSAIHFFFPRTQNGSPLVGSQRQTVEFSFQGEHFVLKCKFTLDPASLL